jgi:uncharacterized protein (TIGR02996 family)
MTTPLARYHPDELAFLAAIIAAPDDNTARLVYADWLDEQDQLHRARYIRQKILGASALGLTGTVGDLLEALAQQEENSIHAFCDWAGPNLAHHFQDKSYYDRGLLSRVWCGEVAHLLGYCDCLFRLAPVQELSISDTAPTSISSLLFRPEMKNMKTLILGYWCWSDAPELIVEALIASPHLVGLQKLEVLSEPNNELLKEGYPPKPDQLSEAQRASLQERFGVVLSDRRTL